MIDNKYNKALIGFSGFVGSNLLQQSHFDFLYNSQNIAAIEGQQIDLLVCCGVSATKWLANTHPQEDIANIKRLQVCLSQATIRHFVLISTIDIYNKPQQVTEDDQPNIALQDHYGAHRYQLEQWLQHTRPQGSYTIIRLPGLFGNNLKKNLIFDILHPLAKTINHSLWQTLKSQLTNSEINYITNCYSTCPLGNLNLNITTTKDTDECRHEAAQKAQTLTDIFARIGFSSLNFTHSDSKFQFYNLANLWQDITNAHQQGYEILNLANEPIAAHEIVKHILHKEFVNHAPAVISNYAMYSKYAHDGRYFYDKIHILQQLKEFVNQYTNKASYEANKI